MEAEKEENTECGIENTVVFFYLIVVQVLVVDLVLVKITSKA